MSRKLYLFCLPILLLLVTGNTLFAQTTPVITHIHKFKPPVVQTFLGKDTGTGTLISVDEGKNIISLPLAVKDAKNNSYFISSYSFLYKRVGVVQDEETGKVTSETDAVGQKFTDTPLKDIWVSNIRESLQKGEEFYFYDIIVKDNQGRLFFAPELRLVMQ